MTVMTIRELLRDLVGDDNLKKSARLLLQPDLNREVDVRYVGEPEYGIDDRELTYVHELQRAFAPIIGDIYDHELCKACTDVGTQLALGDYRAARVLAVAMQRVLDDATRAIALLTTDAERDPLQTTIPEVEVRAILDRFVSNVRSRVEAGEQGEDDSAVAS